MRQNTNKHRAAVHSVQEDLLPDTMVQVAAMRMPSHLLLAAAVVAVVAVCSGRCEGAEPGLQCKLETGVIIGAGNIDVLQVASADACCNACNANSACIAFTFDTSTHACFLKDNLRDNTTQSDRISGTNGRSPNDVFYACQGKFGSLRFCNTSLPLDARLQDLISRVKLDDVGAQLRARQSPQLLDIGVPAYYWGTNAIHGMQNTQCLPDGQCPTSFPAPCGLAATFNMSIVKEMGRIIGRELRAYYNGQFHNSLDTWSPTINPSRDPRWGRNVESPGEDPLVCGLYGSAYTQGLQYGDDPNYYQAIVTLKVLLCVETIFGANNPGGKLPVTMYPSTYVDDIDFLNMSMTTGPGRSYKYYTGTPLFAFGFGLSYTTFNLTWSPAPPSGVLTSPHATKTYTCKVTNTGRVAGDEVVFAFMKPKAATITTLGSDTPVPIKVLFAFERVSLAAGASTTVHFNLTTTMLGLVDNDGHRSVHNGDYDVELTRGHGEELLTTVTVALPAASHPHRISTFRKWW
ncbi:hypothetical protein PTSG_06921 [Salpingoeca rosetta]|uniref:Apple domain-containing protein n=1 Tax=Salpingoeca rosetta (strain ATCC 50818 / BSB-021) TaxID=946362 RepID=F2UF68_SALR5|nr:uncharacterized protein PTSG_06921 [Salpingoeca rosetta]EGD75268.1 hypothetical protein PTSG_06921 [Salpingoeca rosetta]|eukprot:XP_004992321.1 hypothetical protein PTSG_06921 [Salpingoeca rosetta]